MGGLVVLDCRSCLFARESAILGNYGNHFHFLELIIINKVGFHRLHEVTNYDNLKVATIFLAF